MMNNYLKTTVLFVIYTLLFVNAKAQDDCVLKLNEAQKLYENGKIEQIPELLDDCVESGFNRENKIQALRLLTLVYLFEDNTVKAEKTLLSLLKINPEYKINQAVDPVEFIRLFNSFNTAPVFSIGVIADPGFTLPHLIEAYGPAAFNESNAKYKAEGISIAVGLKGIYHINTYWDLSIEPSFSYLSFHLNENVGTVNTNSLTETMKYLNFPLYGSYSFFKNKERRYYGEVGLSYDMFLSGNINGTNSFIDNQQPATEPGQLETGELRTGYNFMGVVGIGTLIALNRSNLKIGLRYKVGLMNVVNPESRLVDKNNELMSLYQDIDNDFSINNICITLSFNREFYRHKKKPNNQTNYDVIK